VRTGGKENGLEVEADATTYMVLSQDQNAGRSHKVKLKIVTVKGWNRSNIWEHHYGIKILFNKKLRAD